ncbi:MAG: hypothetical protein Q9201_007177 [Fulgogasparrea decipioides]
MPETLNVEEIRTAAEADTINDYFAEHPTQMFNPIETYYEICKSILDHESCNSKGQKFATELRKRFADPDYMRKHQRSHPEWEKQFDVRPQAGNCPPRYLPGHHEWKKYFDVRPQASNSSPNYPPGCLRGSVTDIKEEPTATAAARYDTQTERLLKHARDSKDDKNYHKKRRFHDLIAYNRRFPVSSDGKAPKTEPAETAHELLKISDDKEENDVPLYSTIKITTMITLQNRALRSK